MTAPKLAIDTNNGRHYRDPNRRWNDVPSITNVMKRHNKPAINGSNVRKAAEYLVDNWDRLSGLERSEKIDLAKKQQYAKSEASVIGDIVHGWIERFVKGEPPSHDEVKRACQTAQWMWDRFLRFNKRFQPVYTGAEFTVWSNKYGYAGTADLSFRLNLAQHEYHILADTKTGKSTYAETAMQLAAIQNADFILEPDGQQRALPKYDRYAILHLRPRSYTLQPVEKIDEAFEAFLALKRIFDWELKDAPETLPFVPHQTA